MGDVALDPMGNQRKNIKNLLTGSKIHAMLRFKEAGK